jgi:hypothetical protein
MPLPCTTAIPTTSWDQCPLTTGRHPLEVSNASSQEHRSPGRIDFAHDAKAIEKFEKMGFVMSGKRRKRKDPNAIDEESRKAGFKLQKAEKALRETEIVAQFKAMIDARHDTGSETKR